MTRRELGKLDAVNAPIDDVGDVLTSRVPARVVFRFWRELTW